VEHWIPPAVEKNGLVVNHVDAAQLREWHQLVEKGLKILMDNPISKDIYEEATSYLEEYRKAHGG
jgi:ABC-type sulfate transport system substrate-binding protein